MEFIDEPRTNLAHFVLKAYEKDLYDHKEANRRINIIYPEFTQADRHYTSQPWHVIPRGDGAYTIKCDTSYATSGVMEFVFDPRTAIA